MCIKRRMFAVIGCLLMGVCCYAQTLLLPDQVFDGHKLHKDWAVLVEGSKIMSVGKTGDLKYPAATVKIDLKGTTLMPGLIEGHSHILLHPYNETSWDDQVLKECGKLLKPTCQDTLIGMQ